MPETATQTVTDAASITSDSPPQLNEIGVELEYPLNETGREPELVAGNAANSSALRNYFGRSEPFLTEYGNGNGYMGSDHVGAEITSGILPIHSAEPEDWYRAAIEVAERSGYEFAATGYGSTTFGLHQHVSTVTSYEADVIRDSLEAEWARVFWCSSISADSLDPWRHGGIGHPARGMCQRHYGSDGHYEFRLPEPCFPEHFGMMMDFWRILGNDSPEAAVDWARERVHEKDERLSSVRQYRAMEEHYDNFPEEPAFADNMGTDPSVAEWFHDLMQE